MLGLGIDLFQRGAGGAAVTQLFKAVTDTGANIKATAEAVFGKSLVWIKDINNSNNHQLIDTVRGTGVLQSNTNAAETTYSAPSGTSVAWVFNAGGAAVTNTDGAITSQVSANVDAGFSVATYTGNNSTGTIGHGLSKKPELVIIKNRGAVASWYVGSPLLNTGYYLVLNSDAAKAYYNDGSGGAFFNYGGWSDSVVNVYNANSTGINSSSYNYVMYSFHSVDGFSKIGTYSGTGSDQAITGLGFQPDFVLIKRTDTTGNWTISDSARLTSGESKFLYPNLNNAESVSTPITMESDGFSMDGSGGDYNASGGTYLYMAIKGPA